MRPCFRAFKAYKPKLFTKKSISLKKLANGRYVFEIHQIWITESIIIIDPVPVGRQNPGNSNSQGKQTLLNRTNQTKTQDKTVLGSGLHAGNSKFQSSNSKAQDSGFHGRFPPPKFLYPRFDKEKFPVSVGRSIALFSLYVLFFPTERSRGNLTLCLFLCADTGIYARE